MSLKTVSEWASFGGLLSVHDHFSNVTNCTMQFGVYTPPQAKDGPVPVLWYLSGLTCTWANVMEKSGIQKYAAEHGIAVSYGRALGIDPKMIAAAGARIAEAVAQADADQGPVPLHRMIRPPVG